MERSGRKCLPARTTYTTPRVRGGRADGREGEEPESALPHALEYAREEDVGPRPDERRHAAEESGEGERDQQPGGTHAEAAGDVDHDGDEERDRRRVVHHPPT